MQAAGSSPIPQIRTSTQASVEVKPTFVYLYGKELDPNSINFCLRLGRISRLNNPVFEFETAKSSIASVKEQLGIGGDTSNHLLLHVHGCSTGRKGHRKHHFLAGNGMVTERNLSTRKWLEELLCNSVNVATTNQKVLPFIHILSCNSKVLSEEITPGSPLWKSGWFIVYSSSNMTSINHFACSLDVVACYLNLCFSDNKSPDPLSLFYLAGLARGDCITLMGGDLEKPLTLHAPKTPRDLKLTHSIALLEGSTNDKERLLLAGIELTNKERALLPDHDDEYLMGQLLSARMERGDFSAIKKIVQKNPRLLNHTQAVGTLLLSSNIKNNTKEVLLWMLSKGVKINDVDSDGDNLLAYAIAYNNNDMLKLLLELGANPSYLNHLSFSPLITAIEHNKTEAAMILIEHDADINQADDFDTALTLAVKMGQLSVVNCLLQHGADRRAGLSSELVQQARAAGREDIALVLEQALSQLPAWKNFKD